ncbi:MAG TPA: SCP2 sterol-binding domain-containing protein [Anaerolineae bacterium]|nr:SCP2 sterol-binding domain-containing protein [Anaerolineae bacterium]
MGIPFGSDEWAKALMVAINNSDAYKAASKKWEGDLTFVVTKGGGMDQEKYIYLDLWHGECRDAYSSDTAVDSAFVLTGDLQIWKDILSGKTDAIKSLMQRKLKLKGNMMKIMKVPKSATELVACASSLDTEWP